MLRNAKIDLLRRVTLFSGCSKRELNEIARIADEIDFPEGKTLIVRGEPGRQFFIVVEGTVEVVKDGETLPPHRGGSEFYGEISLVSGSPATATVTTTTPVRALVIAPQHFRALLDRSPSIQRRILHAFSERLAPHVDQRGQPLRDLRAVGRRVRPPVGRGIPAHHVLHDEAAHQARHVEAVRPVVLERLPFSCASNETRPAAPAQSRSAGMQASSTVQSAP